MAVHWFDQVGATLLAWYENSWPDVKQQVTDLLTAVKEANGGKYPVVTVPPTQEALLSAPAFSTGPIKLHLRSPFRQEVEKWVHIVYEYPARALVQLGNATIALIDSAE